MKPTLLFLLACGFAHTLQAQSIIGNWQLVKKSTCLEDAMTASDSTQLLIDEMKSRSNTTPQIVKFNDKQSGEETTRILNRRKSTNTRNFLYRFDGEMLMILDKKSRTITDNYMVDKFSADSLVISNVSRPCETKIFLRVK
jgi:hypothetical protein